MKCSGCGFALTDGFQFCPACGRPATVPPTASNPEPFDHLVRDLVNEAERMGRAAVRFSERAVGHADAALKDPSTAARRALDRARKELQQAEHDLDELLRNP